MAHHLGVSASTAHRLARTLLDVGLVAQDHRTERYLLGPALIPLGRAAEARSGFGLLRPDLEELASATGESVNLGVLQGASVLVVSRVASPQPLRFEQEPGSLVPVYASAMGKALLAFTPPAVRPRARRLAPFTPTTITDQASFDTELAAVRSRGWAFNDEERNPGVRALAVPILDDRGDAVAAVAVQGPTMRITDDRLDELASTAMASASSMARHLVGR